MRESHYIQSMIIPVNHRHHHLYFLYQAGI